MSGLRKAKKYDWKDSNLALFGSDLERNVKKAAAETETAWKGAGQKVTGMTIQLGRGRETAWIGTRQKVTGMTVQLGRGR